MSVIFASKLTNFTDFYDNSISCTKGEKRDFIDECEFSV